MNGVINPGIRVTLTISLLTVQLITLESAYTNYSVINQIDEDLKKKEGISTIENATKSSVASNVQDEHKSKNQKLINQNQLTTQDTEPLTQYLEEPVNTNERSNNNSNVKNKEIGKKEKIPVVTNLEYDHVQIQNDVDTRIVNKLKEAFRLGIEKESKTKINNEKVKNESRNKIYDHLKTINDRKFKSKVERELKRQAIKCIREIWRIIEDNLPNNINFQLDSYIDNILKVVNLFMPTKIYIPMEFEESTKLKVFTMKFESKVKVNDVYLEGMHTLQRNTEKKSELILDQLRVAKFRVHVHFLNPEIKIGNYLLKLAGIPLGKGSVNVIMFKLSLTLELDFNMANRTCEEFLKAGVKLTKLKDVKFEVKGGSAIGDGSKKLLLKFLSVLVKKIIKLKRKKIEDTIQKEIADVMKDINPYCNPGSEINEQFMKFVKDERSTKIFNDVKNIDMKGKEKISDNVKNIHGFGKRTVHKLKKTFGFEKLKVRKTKTNEEKVKELENKVSHNVKTVTNRNLKSKVVREIKLQAFKFLKEIWMVFEENLPDKIIIQIDNEIDTILNLVDLFIPTKINIPMNFQGSTEWNVFRNKFESKAKVNEVYLEGMQTLQRDPAKKSKLSLERPRVVKFRVHVHVLNPELRISSYLLKLGGFSLGEGSINVILYKLALTVDLNFNMANRTCEGFLKAGVKLTKLKDVKFEVKGGSAIGDGLKKELLRFLHFLVMKILKLTRKYIEGIVQKVIDDVVKEINPYCYPGNKIDEHIKKVFEGQ